MSKPRWFVLGVAVTAGVAATALVVSFALPPVTSIAATTPEAKTEVAPEGAQALESVLADALTAKKPRGALAPALDQADADDPGREGDCFTPLLPTTSKACVTGDTASAQTAVLIGDSHANQWLTPLSVQAKAAGWRLINLTKARCAITGTVLFNDALRRDYTECQTYMENLRGTIASYKPGLVIVSQADFAYKQAYSVDEWASASVAALKELVPAAAKVTYLSDTPTSSFDPVSCLRQNSADIAACSYNRPSQSASSYHRIVGDSVQKAGYVWFDTFPLFCPTTKCPAVVKNMQVHRDKGHVTNTYATWLTPHLEGVFSAAQS